MANLTVGAKVKWQSQAGGFWKDKSGVIVEVVPPKLLPVRRPKKGVGMMGRTKESYVVDVGNGRLYWPTAELSLVE